MNAPETDPFASLAWIKREASKDPLVLVDMLQYGYHRLLDAVTELTEEQAAARTAAGVSPLDLLAEVAAARRRCVIASTALANGRVPDLRDEARSRLEITSLASARVALERTQAELLAFIHALWPITNVTARWGDTPHGELNCKEWLVYQRTLDEQYAERIAQIAAALNDAKSGDAGGELLEDEAVA